MISTASPKEPIALRRPVFERTMPAWVRWLGGRSVDYDGSYRMKWGEMGTKRFKIAFELCLFEEGYSLHAAILSVASVGPTITGESLRRKPPILRQTARRADSAHEYPAARSSAVSASSSDADKSNSDVTQPNPSEIVKWNDSGAWLQSHGFIASLIFVPPH